MKKILLPTTTVESTILVPCSTEFQPWWCAVLVGSVRSVGSGTGRQNGGIATDALEAAALSSPEHSRQRYQKINIKMQSIFKLLLHKKITYIRLLNEFIFFSKL